MNGTNLLKIALRALSNNKLRAFLTMLGIIIGVASVITMLAIGQGSKKSIQEQIAEMGSNMIMISPGADMRGGVRQDASAMQTLKMEDFQTLQSEAKLISAISSSVNSGGQLIYGANNTPSTVYGVNSDYMKIRQLSIKDGDIFTDQDIKSSAKVMRCYQYDISLDGQPTFVGAAKPYNTVILDQKAQLGAYRLVEDDGTVLYNTYNLLRGDDDWDPQGIKEKVAAIGRRDGRDYADIATCLDMNVHEASIQTGGTPLELSASLMRHVGYKLDNQEVSWRVQPGFERFVTLSNTSGPSCTVTSANHGDKTQTFDIIASTADGLEGAVQVTAAPDFLDPPAFTASPKMTIASGRATVDYSLDLQGREDESLITWYRCDDKRGDGAVPVGVSRFDKPKKTYTTGRDDVGHYIMAGVSPKHLRSNPGREVRVVSKTPVRKSQAAAAMSYSSDFSDFPAENQLVIRPGYWTVDAFKPEDTSEYDWKVDTSKPCWAYGSGINGARGYGLQQLQQGARLLYTPLTGSYNGMKVTWQVDPAKDGGQGFASARMQYLDLFINFDTSTLTGYALRAIRTTKYANAVDILLVRYDHGHVKAISDSITTDCFLTGCQLTVETSGDRISAHVEGPGRIAGLAGDKAVHHTVDITARYVPEGFGGFGLQHTSTVGTESRILIHSVSAVWK